MKTEELIRVVDRELDSLRYNIKAIRDKKTWTEDTEAIFLRFRYEEEALQEIRTILNRMPDEEGPLTLEQLKEKNGKPVWIVECPDWGHWELSEDANDYITDRDPELYGLTYPDPEGKAGLHKLGWVAYDYPIANEWKQGRIDRAAWSECVCNTKEKACCTCVSLRCQFCIGESEYKRGSYCSACGRPLTEIAREKLEKRLTKRSSEI